MISVEEAWRLICARAAPLPSETRKLEDAVGAVLAEPVSAPTDLPPFDNSAMDGYALQAAETQGADAQRPVTLAVVGEVAAGGWQDAPIQPGTTVKIMTGAAVPPGADAVLILEAGRLRQGTVEIRQPLAPGTHIRRRGEDVRRGEGLLEAGTRLNVQRIGLLAGSGIAQVRVHRQVRVSLLATGSELVTDGRPLQPGQIYDSNRIILRALVEQAGGACADLGIVPDDPTAIRAQIQAGRRSDLLLISGGVSVGAHDYVKSVLQELGMETLFWRANMKPGKPLLCGRLGEGWVFGLPGNPISCVVGLLVFIEPLIRRLHGEVMAEPRYATARLTRPVRKQDERRHFLTARLAQGAGGALDATPTDKQGSAMMQALAQANGFVIVPEDRTSLEAGAQVDVLRFCE